MQVRSFWVPKRGNEGKDYEDAFAIDASHGWFAVADGATESSFAREWAYLLVNEYVHSPLLHSRRWQQWLPPLQARWVSSVGGHPLPWYAEEKFAQGAFATFLGLALRSVDKRTWQALAIGDSCLFHIREDCLCLSFPLTKSDDFGNHPQLLGSRTPAREARRREIRARGNWLTGDRFFLATDALAQWFLREAEAGAKPWQPLMALLDDTDVFQAGSEWIDLLRDRHAMRNDDVTVIMVTA